MPTAETIVEPAEQLTPSPSDCASCDEELPKSECLKSKRTCGHHCNHSWSDESCCWCGAEFGEVPTEPTDLAAPSLVDDTENGPEKNIDPQLLERLGQKIEARRCYQRSFASPFVDGKLRWISAYAYERDLSWSLAVPFDSSDDEWSLAIGRIVYVAESLDRLLDLAIECLREDEVKEGRYV